MRMLPSAACTCGRCSTCARRRDVKAMRPFAEEAFSFVREYKGSHSGETWRRPRALGISRADVRGKQLVHAFRGGKGSLRSGGPVQSRQDRALAEVRRSQQFSLQPGLSTAKFLVATRLVGISGTGGGLQGAVEMCNNNGAMSPLARRWRDVPEDFRVTGDEQHVTRGRANSPRLAIRWSAGAGRAHLRRRWPKRWRCVSYKGLPARMPDRRRHGAHEDRGAGRAPAKFGLSLRDRLIGYLPRWRRTPRRISWLMNLRDAIPGAAKISEAIAGLSSRRTLPKWRGDVFKVPADKTAHGKQEVVLFADTFNRYFEPENLDAAVGCSPPPAIRSTLRRLRIRQNVRLCCGRTFLSVSKVDEARRGSAGRTLAALAPYIGATFPSSVLNRAAS